MKRLHIFPKTFLYTLSLMLIIILLSHGLIYLLLPQAYNFRQKSALEADTASLIRQLQAAPPQERMSCVAAFASKWDANLTVDYDGFSYQMNLLGQQVNTKPSRDGRSDVTITTSGYDSGLTITLMGNPLGGADFFQIRQDFGNGKGRLNAVVSRQQIEDAVSVVLLLLPFTAALCTIISVLFALFYSRLFTRPIQQISATAQKMRQLEPDARCPKAARDEIGMLADSINGLYDTLLVTIRELEQEIQKTQKADLQKTNFLRAASHELKTPVTAVNAMLENMLLGIGKYKDRDIYLARCKTLMDQLAAMIHEILDASKMEFAGEQECTEFDLTESLKAIMDPFHIIAKSKGISMEIGLEDDVVWSLPQRMMEKAVSNILANAVSYTSPGDKIYISLEERRLIIENECDPIPPEHLSHIFEPFYRPDYGRNRAAGGNGLGLYIVATILDSLNLDYKFVPSERFNGMSFLILFRKP